MHTVKERRENMEERWCISSGSFKTPSFPPKPNWQGEGVCCHILGFFGDITMGFDLGKERKIRGEYPNCHKNKSLNIL